MVGRRVVVGRREVVGRRVEMGWRWLLLLVMTVSLCGGVRQARAQGRGRGGHREESRGGRGGIQGGLAMLLGGLLPNTYYSRPDYRYPYYDKNGKAGTTLRKVCSLV